MTGQFIIAGSPSAGACHAERYPRGASWCQLNHIKIICKRKCIIKLWRIILLISIIQLDINLNAIRSLIMADKNIFEKLFLEAEKTNLQVLMDTTLNETDPDKKEVLMAIYTYAIGKKQKELLKKREFVI
nr:hypothetical protein [Leuconostoc fallax]